jgi:hypothetical protein
MRYNFDTSFGKQGFKKKYTSNKEFYNFVPNY